MVLQEITLIISAYPGEVPILDLSTVLMSTATDGYGVYTNGRLY